MQHKFTPTTHLKRAALTLLALVMTCATAWAETVETYYIDENGTRHDVTATVVTTYMDNLGTDDETTWYVVNENVFLYDGSNNQTCLHGNVNLIIADGCELKPACGSNGSEDGFRGSGNLTLYGQTAGTGTLSCGQEGFMNITGDFTVCSGMVSVSGYRYNAIRVANFTMRGGSVSIENNTNNDCGIRATGTINIYSGSVVAAGTNGIAAGTVNIYGGSVTAMCNGRNAPGNNYGHAIKCSSTFNFYGGNVTAQSDLNLLEDQTRYGIYANGINLSWTSTDDWIYNTKDVNSNNVICYFVGSGGMNIAPYKPFTDGTTTYTGTLTDEQVEALADKTLQPVVPAFAETGDGTPEHPYTIWNAIGWSQFCDALQDATYNHFSGKTVKLGADISIRQSAGSAGHEFMGTFDGDGKTLTVDITETTTQGTAPFREIKGATIQNLVVTGSVDGTTHAAGLVGFARGADASTVNTITNCKVATNVTVTTPNSAGNYHCGGVVGHAFHCTLNMSNTVYCGDITNSGNNYVGGLQGWSDGNTINFSHCLFVGSYSGTASFHPVAVRNNNSTTTASVSHVYYTVTPTLTNSNFIAANGTKTISRATAPATIGDQTQSLNFMSTTIYQNGICYNDLYYATIGLPSGGTDIYLIDNADDWLYFCDMLNDNATWNRFIGKTVKLDANISVTQSAGSPNHDFCGTFDGQNNTLTFTATATANYLAPFRYVSGTGQTNHAVIQNLDVVTNITATDFRHAAGLIADMSSYVDVTNCNVTANITANKGNTQTQLFPAGLVSQVANGSQLTVSGCTVSGTISTDGKFAGGMVGIVQGSANITNSVSSVTINSSTDGDGTHGGFVASLVSDRQLTIEGCVFNGKIVTTNGLTTKCGGFLGHDNTNGGTGATITNCLYAPAADPNTVSTDCATFGRNVNSDLISNCYYTTALGDAQGTQAYSITAGDYVTTLANAGTVSNNYTTSGLIFYNVGLKYGDVLYAASNDEVSLTLGCTLPEGYVFNGYTVSPTEASLTGNDNDGYTLTMPNGNVTINATLTPIIRYIDEYGETQQCTEFTLLTGNETTLGTSGQETWYVADGMLDYSQTINLNGNVHLILKDNAVMNVGTEETPINGRGIDGSDHFIRIYGQSTGDHIGTLSVYTAWSNCNGIRTNNLTINGGHVIANTNGKSSNALYAYNGDVVINGGIVEATATDAEGYAHAIYATYNFTYTGGIVEANAASGYAINAGWGQHYTFTWRNPNDRITIGSTGLYNNNNGDATATFTNAFTDGTNIYSGTLTGTEAISGLAGKTLYPNCVVMKQVAGYGEGNGGWVFIASPVAGSIAPSEVHNLLGSYDEATGKYDYDLYRFNQSDPNGKEWQNWNATTTENHPDFTSLVNGQGYLYATKETRTLVFAGEYTAATAPVEVPLVYDEGKPLAGWNLVGNPFTVGATSSQPFYRMNEGGTALSAQVEVHNSVAAMEGVFVQATAANQTVSFTAQTRGGEQAAIAQANIMVVGDNGVVIDNAIVRFDGGQTLEKFSFREGSTKIYIPQDGTDYAIACAESTGEMPVNFKAETDGTYKISVNVDNVEMGYLHLIDNMTGADVDLLAANGGDARPCVSTYTFTAKTTDYESRFKLVFAVGSSAGSDTFAFFSNGNIIVNGEGMLQVIDMTGRIVLSIGGHTRCVPTTGMTAGVYVLRLINGEKVRTQKIVVE